MTGIRRRDLITGTALVLVGETLARAEVISSKLPWRPDAGVPPHRVQPGPWKFFTLEEAAAVQAAVDRLIPPDPQTPGGRDAGCAVFIDRQLAGGYGHHEGLYDNPPFQDGIEQQGPQSSKGPADMYRAALAALDKYCRSNQNGGGGKAFAELTTNEHDAVLHGAWRAGR